MVNTLTKNNSPLPEGKFGKTTKQSTWRRNEENHRKCCLELAWVQALGPLCSFLLKQKFAAEMLHKMHWERIEEKEQWIKGYMESEMAAASNWVEDADMAIKQVQEHMEQDKNAGLTTRKPVHRFENLFNAIQ